MDSNVGSVVKQEQLSENITRESPEKAYTAYIAQENGWWIGWVQGIRGVNCQERTKEELLCSLKLAVPEMLALNPEEFIDEPEPHFEPITIQL